MEDTPISNPIDDDTQMNPIDGGDTNGRPLVWLLLGVIAIGCGVLFAAAFVFFQPNMKSLTDEYFPSPTATITRTPTSTRTPTVTPSPILTRTQTATPTPNTTRIAKTQHAVETTTALQATVVSAANWKVVLSEPFDSNRNNWYATTKDDDYSKATFKIAGGKYTWNVTSHRPNVEWIKVKAKSLGDFYLSVDAYQRPNNSAISSNHETLPPPKDVDYGVMFRKATNSDFYYFGLNGQGQYCLFLYDSKWLALINWTNSDLIHPQESNRITIIGNDSHFTFFINDQYLTEITDDRIPSGGFALAIEMGRADENAIFEFDNLELRAP